MPFLLSRGGKNVAAEVQRWQYFLLTQGFTQVGKIDGDFGLKSETATRFFQVREGLPTSGKLDTKTLDRARDFGYQVLPNNYYKERADPKWPAKPSGLSSPTSAWRNQRFTCFKFVQQPKAQRPYKEAVVITSSCDGSVSDWTATNIVTIPVNQLRFASGYTGSVLCHKLAAPVISALFAAWEQAHLLHLIMSYEGCFVPRYKRNQAPGGNAGHGTRKSSEVAALSNHSFGSAFDLNFVDNQLEHQPALCGARGSVRELVAAANALSIFWGGHFSNRDGMHFEMTGA